MFQNMAEFIDAEAKEYGEGLVQVLIERYSVVSWCGSGLDQRAETEFSNIHSALEYDYLNALNETIENVG